MKPLEGREETVNEGEMQLPLAQEYGFILFFPDAEFDLSKIARSV
jgi:hypothetical protein